MSDSLYESDETESRPGSSEGVALSLALSAAAHNETVAAKAARFLDEQTKLVRLQAEDLRKEDKIRHWSLRVRHINDLLRLAFGVSGAVLVSVIALGVLALVWSAHEATGLVIQPLKAPPDFAERGLDGTVLAQRLLDKLNADIVAGDTFSFRAADNVSGNWGNDSKVQIPETGISIFELTRFLRQWLGHETSMSGELYHVPRGIALTVRVGSDPGTTFEGREEDIDALISHAALDLLRQTQPYRYLWSLHLLGQPAASVVPIAATLVGSASDKERPWMRSAWEEMVEMSGDYRRGVTLSRETVAIAPDNAMGFFDLAPPEWAIGHLEGALTHIETAERLLTAGAQTDLEEAAIPFMIDNCRSFAADLRGAYNDAVVADIAETKSPLFDLNVSGPASLANDLALDHDTSAARAVLAQHPQLSDDIILTPQYITVSGPDMPNFFVRAMAGDWAGARAVIERTDALLRRRNDVNDVRQTLVWPWLAYSLAKTGSTNEGAVLIAKTPLDCTLCLDMRGRIAEAVGDTKAAARWYQRAIADAPSLPFSYTDWGTMLLRHGDKDGAMAQFRLASLKSPHFADAHELMGEALIAQNRSDLAIAAFEDANTYAPAWGRLHRKWGEALSYVGRSNDARAQFAIARKLALAASEHAELGRF